MRKPSKPFPPTSLGLSSELQKQALRLILLLGLVSLLADVTYEGARSIVGPYLALLGASAFTIGFVSGFSELLGYAFRLASGSLVDRLRRYWSILLLGYFINLISVPLLALAGRWEVAALLIFAERLGKAIRTPARDVVLSYASSNIGLGKGYAIHEVLDQVGAILGPFIVAAVFLYGGSYREGFALLAVPAASALLTLSLVARAHPKPERMEKVSEGLPAAEGAGVVRAYLLFVGFSVAGFAPYQLIAYHMSALGFADATIPLLFSLAMGVDAVAALVVGRYFDRFGLSLLVAIPVFTALVTPLAFSEKQLLIALAPVFWGVVMGMHETILRAGVAKILPAAKRGVGFGALNAVLGIAWFIGGSALGSLYNVGYWYLVSFSVALEICSIPPFILLIKRMKRYQAKVSQSA
ncbi:MAG: MFS transporter [Thaumarchaeota archaeon]|nr:MFS transporter [Nitrososphaerota archaeon]